MSAPARRRWANVALAVAAPLVFFGVLELALAAAGVEPVVAREDPFVSFAGTLPLFVPESDVAGGEEWMVTADGKLELFNPQRFPRRKAPGTFRIFCLGGSTTFGQPYDDATSFAGWLRAFLPVLDPGRRWEVINAGGISYASYRVARLMEELSAYEPDLFIVYTGHNEFLEERTYRAVRDLPRPVRAVSAALARTRTWAVLRGALRRVGGGAARRAEEPAGGRSLLPEAVAARLDRSAGLDLYERDDVLQRQVLRHYRSSLERMTEIARAADAALVFVTPASNLRSSSPFKSQHTDGVAPPRLERAERLLALARQQSLDAAWDGALATLDEALALDPRFADLHYERGRALFAGRRFAEAKRAFERARDEDVCPLRALSAMEVALAEVAAATGTPRVDFIDLLERDLERSHGHAVLGEEDFLDHVHPTVDAHRRLALALAAAMRRRGLLPAAEPAEETLEAVRRQVVGNIDAARHAEALASLAWTLDWAGKEEDSRRLALQALQSGAETPAILLIAGKHLALGGETERATDLYRRAVRADPLSPTPRYQMGLLAIDRGRLEEAAAHFFLATVLWPDDAKAHEKLGLVMAERGRYALAIASLEEARRRDPGRRAIADMIAAVRRHAGAALGPAERPGIGLDRHPSGVVARAAQTRRGAAGEVVFHGIYTEWAADGTLRRFADADGGELRGIDLRWDAAGRVVAAEAPGD